MSSMRVRFCCAASSFSSADAPPRLVLRDAGRFLDQLTPIGRARAEDQPDLALLDDRVGLRAEPGVHQQVVDVAQPADLTVDQVFALARAIQAARDFDFARDRLNQLLGVGHRHAGGRRVQCRCRGRCRCATAVASVPLLVAVARCRCRDGWPLAVAVVAVRRVAGNAGPLTCLQHAAEPQPHFGGGRRLARVAAVEDDVFHPLAAQALGALLAHHPRDGVGDVALAAPVRADNGRHALVEGQLGAVGERFEAVDFETFETHGLHHGSATRSGRALRHGIGGLPKRMRRGQSRTSRLIAVFVWLGGRTTTDRLRGPFAFRLAEGGPGPRNGRQCNKA